MVDSGTSQANMNGGGTAKPVAIGCPPHGRGLRGLMSTPQSVSFEGRFGRMFQNQKSATFGKTPDESMIAMKALAKVMLGKADDKAKNGPDGEESGIPALYTYFGQFVDHDLTFDPVSTLTAQNDPDALTDFRSPAFDLDNMYGRGPDDQPYLYDGEKFHLGDEIGMGATDLPRNNKKAGRALIGDPRNDENTIISQFQGLMLQFHNRVHDDHAEDKNKPSFSDIQRTVRWHYQWVVLNDFLPRIVNNDVLEVYKTDGHWDQSKLKHFCWKKQPYMPVEFSVAAYRLGHSMVRPGYRLNDDKDTLLPIFVPDGAPLSLTGFRAVEEGRAIDWGRFINVGAPRPYGKETDTPSGPEEAQNGKRLQLAYRLDTSLVNPLGYLPNVVTSTVTNKDPSMPSLAERNLVRGFRLGLPSGESVAHAMHLTPLEPGEIIIGKATEEGTEGNKPILEVPDLASFVPFLKGNTPLWTYILAEAARNKLLVPIHATGVGINGSSNPITVNTPQLGPVGGRIVAEVFLGLMFGDKTSYLSCNPMWKPTIWQAERDGKDFELKHIVAYALGRKNAEDDGKEKTISPKAAAGS